jgi:type I restriction-modification system DNA methylase subunit/restriction endonuclease S subunit
MSNIMDKNAWFSFLHTLHNITRNGKGIKLTGLPALNEINNFLVLMFLENKIESYGLPNHCKFTYLRDEFCTDAKIKEDENQSSYGNKNCYKLWKKYCDISETDCVIRLFATHAYIKKYIKNNVNSICAYTEKHEAGVNIQKIINEIYKKFDSIANFYNKNITQLTLDDWDFDAFGLAYEQWKSDSVSEGGKNTGQHFTPLELKQYIIKDLEIKDNEIFYEPACGTGGFITTAYKYIKETKQDLEKFKNNVFANECNPEIYKPLLVNMLIHEMPIDNICADDSLTINNCNKMKDKVDVCGANPPFGGGDDIQWSEYWGPLKTGKKVIKKMMMQFLIHMIQSLKVGGRCSTVMDRMILNNGYDEKNGWENKFRKYLVENVNITKIVIIETGTFPYTNIATAIFKFTKGEKTKEIKYYQGKLKDPKNKSGFYVEDEPFEIRKYDDLVKNNYNLKVDKDEEAEVIDENIKYVKLGDVCIIKSGKPINKENRIGTKYPYYAANGIVGYIDEYIFDGTFIICAQDGSIGATYYVEKCKFYPSNHTWILNSLSYNNKFIYYLMYIGIKYDSLIKKNCIPKLTKSDLEKIKIPEITLSHQQEIVKLLDEEFSKYNIQKLVDYPNSNKLFKLLIYKKYDDFLDAMHLIYRKIEADAMHLIFEKDKKAIFNWLVKKEDCESKKLGDVCDIDKNIIKHDTKYGKSKGNYKFHTGGIRTNLYVDEYDIEDMYIIQNRTNGSGKCNLFLDKKFSLAKQTMVYRAKNKNEITTKYIYYYLLTNINILEKGFIGALHKNISHEYIININIPIPSKQKQQEIIDQIESINKQQETYKQYGDLLEKQITQIFETIDTTLFDITSNNSDNNEPDQETNQNIINNESEEIQEEEQEEEQEELIEEVKPKKTRAKKVSANKN